MRVLVPLFIGSIIAAILFSFIYGGVLAWQEGQRTRQAEASALAQVHRVEQAEVEAASRERLAELEQTLTEKQAELNKALAELEESKALADAVRISAQTNQQVTLQLADEAARALRDDRRIAGWSFVRATVQEAVLGLLLCAGVVIFTVLSLAWLRDRSPGSHQSGEETKTG